MSDRDGSTLVTQAYMVGLALWFLVAAAMNAGMLGSDRFETQYLPLGVAMAGEGAVAQGIALALQATGFVFEGGIAVTLMLGVVSSRLRRQCLAVATALMLVLFAGFLSAAFAFRVGKVPAWQQQASLVLGTVLGYAAITAVHARRERASPAV